MDSAFNISGFNIRGRYAVEHSIKAQLKATTKALSFYFPQSSVLLHFQELNRTPDDRDLTIPDRCNATEPNPDHQAPLADTNNTAGN